MIISTVLNIDEEWKGLPFLLGLTADNIVHATVYRGRDVYEFAAYLEASLFPGILEAWVPKCIETVRPFFEEIVPITGEVTKIFEDPRRYFSANTDQEVRDCIMRQFSGAIGRSSPAHLKSTMVAFIENSLGNWKTAIAWVEKAWCEKDNAEFDDMVSAPDGERKAFKGLVLGSTKTAEPLVEIIKARRKVKSA